MDRYLLVDTKEVVPTLGPLYSDIENETLKKINDNTLSKSIPGLVLNTVILEIESARREKRRKEIFVKLKGNDVRALSEDLKKRDEELMEAVEKWSILEETLRRKEEEFELSKGVEDQCSDLQAQVVQLRGQLKECQFQVEALRGEIAEKQEELEKVESSWLDARRKVDILELANKILRAERENNKSMARAKEDRLEERMGEMDKETSELYDRVDAFEAEKAQLLERPSSSNASDFPNIPYDLYE
ncbi:peroxisomal and mitochondrial division factor 2-like [Nicotiana tomentosiformis]|uniref:peroxisomal and mitochondrial division factor 2-like n=1 Tax=Nicotiana tomentosiformis TaxID=4098 RepID=UPI00388CE2A0